MEAAPAVGLGQSRALATSAAKQSPENSAPQLLPGKTALTHRVDAAIAAITSRLSINFARTSATLRFRSGLAQAQPVAWRVGDDGIRMISSPASARPTKSVTLALCLGDRNMHWIICCLDS